jgi:hypothetical protein
MGQAKIANLKIAIRLPIAFYKPPFGPVTTSYKKTDSQYKQPNEVKKLLFAKT